MANLIDLAAAGGRRIVNMLRKIGVKNDHHVAAGLGGRK